MALHDLSNGSNNIALGHTAGQYSTSGNRNVYISNGGPVESNTTRIGDANQAKTFISGIWNVVIGGGARVVVDSNGQLGNAGVSSRLYKRDIVDIGERAEFLYELRPMSFKYNEDLDPLGIPHYGLIAEEVTEIAPELVFTDDRRASTDRPLWASPLLLNELRVKNAEIHALQAQVEDPTNGYAELLARIEALEVAAE